MTSTDEGEATVSELPTSPAGSSWFADDPSKAYYERLSLIWAPLSMLILLAGVLGTPLYKYCDRNSFLAITLVGCLPGFVIPLFWPCKADRERPFSQRFWVKGTLWIAIFGFYGNYFWTHYFYEMLGAEYLFDSYRFNDVPVICFLATFFYFTFYFNFINLLLRRIARFTADLPAYSRRLIWCTTILTFSYATAIFEAVTIQHFPLYTYKEKEAFLFVGSIVYGVYFVVGYPMYFSLDEVYAKPPSKPRSTAQDAVFNSLAATAIVTLLLDLWRLYIGSIYNLGVGELVQLPFVYQKGAECSTPLPTPDVTVNPQDCIQLASKCANVAGSWMYTTLSSVAERFQSRTDSMTAPVEEAAKALQDGYL